MELTALPRELKNRVSEFLKLKDRVSLAKTNRGLKEVSKNVIDERRKLSDLARQLDGLVDEDDSNYISVYSRLIHRLKHTKFPNRRYNGIPFHTSLNKDNVYRNTKSVLKKAVKAEVAKRAPESLPNDERDPLLVGILLEVLDAVFLPDLQANAPQVHLHFLLSVIYESYYTQPDSRGTFISLRFEASGTKRGIFCNYLPHPDEGGVSSTAYFEGIHEETLEPKEGGWGIAYRLTDLKKCKQWKRSSEIGALEGFEELITQLILHSGMFYVRPPDDQNSSYTMFISAGFADACARY